jgi:hypothetical protein
MLGGEVINGVVQAGLGVFGDSVAQQNAKRGNQAAINSGNLVGSTVAGTNPVIANSAAANGGSVVSGTQATGGAVTNASQYYGGQVVGDGSTANTGLNPYSTTGNTATTMINSGLQDGQFSGQPSVSQVENTPGYQFELQQGLNAVNRSAAAQGGALSGGDIKAADSYANGLAGTNYQQAFSNYETAQQNSFQNLMQASNAGQTASTQQGLNTINTGEYNATSNNQANEFAAGANNNASQYSATMNNNAADQTATNTNNAAIYGGNALLTGAGFSAAGSNAGTSFLANGLGNAGSQIANGAGGAGSGGGVGQVPLSTLLANPADTPYQMPMYQQPAGAPAVNYAPAP